MKKTISLKFILSSAILAGVLMGDHSLPNSTAQTPPPAAAPVSAAPDNSPTASPLPSDIDPDSPLAQVVRLVQAGVEQSVILTYINNSTNLFNLDADRIIYLNDLGVPTEVINAMMQRDQQLEQMGVAAASPPQPAVTTETTAPPAEVTVNYFYDTLAPYGGWVDIEGYGWCWRPTIVIYDTGWQPYCNNGHWVYTDYGWYWVSGYSWGWAAFHYGRWFHSPHYGWCWWPDTTWAPSWVCWRYNRDYCGWAPLPPHAVYRSGVGFFYDGHQVSAGFNFGLSAGVFTFVPTKDFCGPHPWQHRLGARDVDRFYDHTTVINNINFDRHHQGLVNAGIPPRDITAVTRQQIHLVTIRAVNGSLARGDHREQFEQGGRTLIVNRPHFVGNAPLTLNKTVLLHNTAPITTKANSAPPPGVINGNGHDNPPHNNYQRVPQAPNQSPMPHGATQSLPEHNHTIAPPVRNYSPSPAPNQTPNYNSRAAGQYLSPRMQQFQFQTPHPATPVAPNASAEEHFSSPPAANYYRYSAPRNNYSAPGNESHYNNQQSVHSESQPGAVQPHTSYHSSSSSSRQSGKSGQDKGNGQGGH